MCLIFEEISREEKKKSFDNIYLTSIATIKKLDMARGKNKIPIWEMAWIDAHIAPWG